MDIGRLKAALEELRPEDKLHVTITHWNEAPKVKGDRTPCAANYAASIVVNGRTRWIAWGTGYANEAIPPVVFGIASILKVLPEGRDIPFYVLPQLWDYVKPNGIGQHAMERGGLTKGGKALGCYPAIGGILSARTARRWHPRFDPRLQEAVGFSEAIAWARGKAKAAALQHKTDHAPKAEDYPKAIILQDFVDVFRC